VLHASGGDIRQHKPIIYQNVDGARREIAGGYVRKGANRVGFQLAAYDTTRPLVIDPIVLSYSTYLGGSGDDSGGGIAVDADGNAYVAGRTSSPNFPTVAGAFQPTGGSTTDAFVAKIVDVVPPPPTPTSSGTTRSEESAATEIGFWTSYGAETGTFSGGSIVASNVAASSAMFSFTGTALSWIGVKCNVCGIAAVSIDGGAPATVNTSGPNAPGSLTSESVFSASGLAATSHTILPGALRAAHRRGGSRGRAVGP